MAESKVKMVLGIRPFLTFIFFVVAITMFIILSTQSAETHGSPIIDGAFTGDWCARASAGLPGPDTLVTLMPPGCPLGTEFFWDDWDAINYGGGIADTMGWLVGGGPGAPMTDLETDMDFFVTTADNSTVFFAVALGPFPSTGGSPPHVQIAIDIDGAPMGNFFFYDPLAVGLLPAGLAALPAPLPSDYLITTDVMAGTGFLWEATTAPGTWTLVGPVPLGWSGPTGMPGVVEIAVPWGMFGPGPAFGPTIPAHMTVMSTHSAAFAGLSDAPMLPEDDVMTELGAGFTTSPDVCPPGPPSSDCEMFFGPGGGGGSADAFIAITYPAIPTPTPTNTPTPSLTPTHTPSPTDTLTPTPSLTPTYTPAPTDTPTPSLTPTLTPGPTDTPTPTATATATATPVIDYDWYLPAVVYE